MTKFSIRKLDLSSYNVRFLSKYRIWFAVPIVVILIAVILLIIMVQIFQWAGMKLSRALDRRNR